MRILVAGAAYFLIVFVAGIVLGMIRVGVLAPNLGATIAVLIELPVILVISWYVCAAILRRVPLDSGRNEDVLAGALAFVLLIGAEALFAVGLGGRTLPEFFAHLVATDGLIGLLGQILFAAFPAIQTRRFVQ
ncbi:hypothetical protein GGR25_003742 [Kaistia hirudinis]|uniref:Uncharacterized protein n=1 Tax=Kaistia hirudinis TaxID=1293440 RepID=A0A840AT20_9HYPH|nr:hypothetical protein [Kaistia hirudinis]MBB3932684.1 hypothetical protein [Kaistia hirudinis]